MTLRPNRTVDKTDALSGAAAEQRGTATEALRLPTRILVIEDNPANMELMTYLLRAYGYELMAATDGEAGLATAAKEQPDMIICDVHLPQLDGYGVVRVLKRHPQLRSIPTVAVTALAMVGDRDKLLDAGFDGYISKPIDPESFIADIAKFLPADQRPTEVLNRPKPPVLLVICDTGASRTRLAPQLASYETVWAKGVMQGAMLAQNQAFAIALVDLEMPASVCSRELEEAKAIPSFSSIPLIIFGSRPSDESTDAMGTNSGIARFLQRTVEPGALADEIETCLRQKNRRQDGDHIDR